MKKWPSSPPEAVTSNPQRKARRTLTPLRALPKYRLCEDVYPGGFRSTLAGRIYPASKVIPFPGTKAGAIEAKVAPALRDFSPSALLCAMLFFAPPVDHFAAFRVLKGQNPEPRP